tara:strand:+ start:85 stop:705 length:621 start_codon:yes stop_codon:yes gene_type:complete
MNIGKHTKKRARIKSSAESESEEEEHCCLDDTIFSNGNKVYFYQDITGETILKLKKVIEKILVELEEIRLKFHTESHIELHIYSNGGDVFVGLDMYNYIRQLSVPVYTYIDGMIASAATFVYLAGDKRFISDYNHVLIHQLSTSFWGKYEDLMDEFNNSKSLMECIRDLYKKNTKIPKDKLNNLLKRELLLNTQECIKYKVATDKI